MGIGLSERSTSFAHGNFIDAKERPGNLTAGGWNGKMQLLNHPLSQPYKKKLHEEMMTL
jgi:hypothetical protein